MRVGDAGVGNEGLVGGDDVGVCGLGEVGEEEVVPGGGSGDRAHVLDVEDVVLEVFIEDAGLDFEGGLRGFELIFQLEQIAGGARREVKGVDQAEAERGEGEDGDDADKAEGPDAAGAHGGDLAVGGETAEAKEDSGEDGGGQRDGEEVGQGVGEDAQDIGEGGGVADDELEDLGQVAHEEHKGEEDHAEQSVGDDFAEDVSGEQAHIVLSLSVMRQEARTLIGR